jgi:hypothetical protein
MSAAQIQIPLSRRQSLTTRLRWNGEPMTGMIKVGGGVGRGSSRGEHTITSATPTSVPLVATP